MNAMDKISLIIHPFGISCHVLCDETLAPLLATYMNFFDHLSHAPCLIGRCLIEKFYFIEYIGYSTNCMILMIILIRKSIGVSPCKNLLLKIDWQT